MEYLVILGVLVLFMVWLVPKVWRVYSPAAEAEAEQTKVEPKQAKLAAEVQQAAREAVLRHVAARVADREAEGVGFWDAAQSESDLAGVPLFDVVGQINDDANAKDAAEEAARQRVFARRYEFDLDEHVDLRELPSVRLKVVAMWRYTDKRASFMSGPCRLVREPDNSHDPNAITVFIGEEHVGYVNATKAKLMAPLMDRIGKPLLIGADLTESRVVMLLPSIPALRSWVKEHRG